MSMAQLIAAGAPELPEGYFYRVRNTAIKSLKVEIRRARAVGSELLADTYVIHENYPTAEAAIVRACQMAYEHWQERDEVAAKYRATTAFVGDHDPQGVPTCPEPESPKSPPSTPSAKPLRFSSRTTRRFFSRSSTPPTE